MRVTKRTATPYRSPRAKARSKPAPKVKRTKRKRVSNVSSAKRARKGSASLKKVVVANAKAIKSIKDSAWGKYQSVNSVIGGLTSGGRNGDHGLAVPVSSGAPVMLQLSNLHSEPLYGAPHFLRRKAFDNSSVDAFGNGTPIALDKSGISPDFTSLGQFSSNGVLQKTVFHKSTGNNSTPAKTPYPNGEKVKWKGIDLTFEVSGALRNTTLDFWIVQEKPQTTPYDPWHTQTQFELGKARHLPYTIQEFAQVSDRMTPHKIDTSKYVVKGHKRCFVNNMNHTTGQQTTSTSLVTDASGQIDYGSGEIVYGAPTNVATTKETQFVHMKFCPDVGMYPLKKAIGESVDSQERMGIRPNPYEPRSIGTMSWDNFAPARNVWLIVTTDHHAVVPRTQLNGETALAYRKYLEHLQLTTPKFKCLRRTWWQDEHTPSATMGTAALGSRTLEEQAEDQPAIDPFIADAAMQIDDVPDLTNPDALELARLIVIRDDAYAVYLAAVQPNINSANAVYKAAKDAVTAQQATVDALTP